MSRVPKFPELASMALCEGFQRGLRGTRTIWRSDQTGTPDGWFPGCGPGLWFHGPGVYRLAVYLGQQTTGKGQRQGEA